MKEKKRTREEIAEYLDLPIDVPGWEEWQGVYQSMLDTGEMLEEQYYTELHGDGNPRYGYGVEADFDSIPHILEDTDGAETLHPINVFDGIVLYSISANTPQGAPGDPLHVDGGRRLNQGHASVCCKPAVSTRPCE